MINLRVRKWIQRRKKSYKLATNSNFIRLNRDLNEDIEQKLESLVAKSIRVSFDSLGDNGLTPIKGIVVNRSNLPDSRVNEHILLINCQTNIEEARGFITSVNSTEVKIKLEKPFILGESDDPGKKEFKIVFDQQNLIRKKKCVENALRRFKRISCSLPIHKCLLGYYKDESNIKYEKAKVVPINGLKPPRGTQILAVEQSLRKRISLIEGVAGSGKTLVAANIACSSSRLRGRKVLICSPSQSTVDKLTDLISNTEYIKVAKLQKRPQLQSLIQMMASHKKFTTIKDCSLDVMVNQAIYKRAWNRLRSSPYESRREQVKLHNKATRLVLNSSNWLRRKTELNILSKADVVCCTLSEAGNACLKGVKFDMLIIDDVQVANEIDCAVPLMMKGLKQVTLLSDIRIGIRMARCNGKQQSNDIEKSATKSKISSTSRSNNSFSSKKTNTFKLDLEQIREPGRLFEKLLAIGLAPVALKYQYRMQETLAAFPNYRFYLSRLKTDPSINEQLEKRIFEDFLKGEDRFSWLPNRECLTALFDSLNVIDTARDIINKLVSRENVSKDMIGIITNDIANTGHNICDIKSNTIDEFFGQERDFIVLLALETDRDSIESKNINYLSNDVALNSALTRARLGLFIVADVKNLLLEDTTVCETHKKDLYCDSWQDLVKYYAKNKLVT